jgi:hypothetical protein
MPRQAAAATGFATGTSGTTRMLLKPPDDLDQLERAEFVSLIVGAPPSHFLPSDVPLVACYAKAIVAERVAAGELAAAYVVDGKPSPWLAIWQAKIRAATTLARMLSLSPGGRVASKPAEAEPVSYYSRLALEMKDNEDPAERN